MTGVHPLLMSRRVGSGRCALRRNGGISAGMGGEGARRCL